MTVIREAAQRGNKVRYFLCECECGKRWEVRLRCLTEGQTKSCGCLRRERFVSGITTHGLSGGRVGLTRLYSAWNSMRQRCSNEKHPNYKDYGGRGISVCAAWDEYAAFHEWATSNGYDDDLTIERKDVNGDYCPDNCTWIPQSEQSNNTRRSREVTFRGETRTLRDWADHLGINRDTLWGRFHAGWSAERALTTPADTSKVRVRR